MDPKLLHDLKLAVAVGVFIGTSMQMLAEKFGPGVLTDNRKPKVPEWVKTIGSWLTLLASGVIVVLEFLTPV